MPCRVACSWKHHVHLLKSHSGVRTVLLSLLVFITNAKMQNGNSAIIFIHVCPIDDSLLTTIQSTPLHSTPVPIPIRIPHSSRRGLSTFKVELTQVAVLPALCIVWGVHAFMACFLYAVALTNLVNAFEFSAAATATATVAVADAASQMITSSWTNQLSDQATFRPRRPGLVGSCRSIHLPRSPRLKPLAKSHAVANISFLTICFRSPSLRLPSRSF